jgi:hypothetical protein
MLRVYLSDETWLSIPGFPGYAVSTCGQVRSLPPLKNAKRKDPVRGVLSQHLSRKGYPRVIVRVNGKGSVIEVHRLLAAALFGPPNGLTVNHKNGVKTENTAENLEYVTNGQNQQHACDLGLCRSKRQRAIDRATVLDEEKVAIILSLENTMSQRGIARHIGVGYSSVNHVLTGRQWGHATGRKVA